MKGTVTSNGYIVLPGLSEVVSRREAFMAAVWAGLASPAMLMAGPTSYLLYDSAAGVQHAWGGVGRQISTAMQDDDNGRR